MTLKDPNDSLSTKVKEQAVYERLYQSSLAFNLDTLTIVLSGLLGIGLALSGYHAPGAITTTSSLAACCLRFSQKASDRLDKSLEKFLL